MEATELINKRIIPTIKKAEIRLAELSTYNESIYKALMRNDIASAITDINCIQDLCINESSLLLNCPVDGRHDSFIYNLEYIYRNTFTSYETVLGLIASNDISRAIIEVSSVSTIKHEVTLLKDKLASYEEVMSFIDVFFQLGLLSHSIGNEKEIVDGLKDIKETISYTIEDFNAYAEFSIDILRNRFSKLFNIASYMEKELCYAINNVSDTDMLKDLFDKFNDIYNKVLHITNFQW